MQQAESIIIKASCNRQVSQINMFLVEIALYNFPPSFSPFNISQLPFLEFCLYLYLCINIQFAEFTFVVGVHMASGQSTPHWTTTKGAHLWKRPVLLPAVIRGLQFFVQRWDPESFPLSVSTCTLTLPLFQFSIDRYFQ